MKIGIIGATGNAGRALYAEAVKRGHEVTAMMPEPDRARTLLGPDIAVLAKDAFDLASPSRPGQPSRADPRLGAAGVTARRLLS